MSKNRTPGLADWQILFTSPAAPGPPSRIFRATSLQIRDGAVVLSDTYGHPLFAAPLGAVCCVRRMEPGEKAPDPEPVPRPVPEPAKPVERIALEPKQARPRGRTAK